MKTIQRAGLVCGLIVTTLSSLHAMEPPKPSRASDPNALAASLNRKIRRAVDLPDSGNGHRLSDVQSTRRYPFSMVRTYGDIHQERVLLAQRAVDAYWDPEFEGGDSIILKLVIGLSHLHMAIEAGENSDEHDYFANPLLAQAYLTFYKRGTQQFFEAVRHIFSWAIRHGYNDTLAVALANGEDPNSRDGGGQTALHKVARIGNVTAARMLLDYGAQWNAQRPDGQTPLDFARIYGDGCPIARLLLSHGAAIGAEQERQRQREEALRLVAALTPGRPIEVMGNLFGYDIAGFMRN